MKISAIPSSTATAFLLLAVLVLLSSFSSAFAPYSNTRQYRHSVTTSKPQSSLPIRLASSASSAESSSSSSSSTDENNKNDIEFTRNSDVTPSDEWELDCYSRPVVVGGKKLWEVLVTDSTGSFRFCKTLPSNQVNSKQVRSTLEQDLMERYVDQFDLKNPSVVRFFRGAMFNMLNIALSDLDVISRPSRCTFALAQWLEERHKTVYPKMEGYALYSCTSICVVFVYYFVCLCIILCLFRCTVYSLSVFDCLVSLPILISKYNFI